MKRIPDIRLGCDRCKLDLPTYRYDRATGGNYHIWICEGCEQLLLEWPKQKGRK